MFSSRRGVVLKSPAAGLARIAVAAVALSVAGCATDEEFRREREAYMRHVQAQQQAMAPRVREPELEADGLPSQVAPPVNRRRDADDPSEPFSPNYGKPNSGSPGAGPQRTTIAPTPDDAPTAQRQVASYRAP
jgi:hypothetical protein